MCGEIDTDGDIVANYVVQYAHEEGLRVTQNKSL